MMNNKENITSDIEPVKVAIYDVPQISDEMWNRLTEQNKIDLLKKQIVTNTLIKAGARISDKGFYLSRDIILLYAEKECPVDVKFRKIGSVVAQKYKMCFTTMVYSVNRMINKAMSLADIDFIENYFGTCYSSYTATVTPRAFLLRIVDDVKMQYEVLEKGGVIGS